MNENKRKEFFVPYTWHVSGTLKVKALSLEEACEKVERMDMPTVYDPDSYSMSVNRRRLADLNSQMTMKAA